MTLSIHITTFFILMVRGQGSASGIPSARTDVQYFANAFPWNEARERCVASGGRLLQPETEMEYSYVKSVLKELKRKTSANGMEVWMGMILARPGHKDVVWVDGCRSATYDDFPSYEPNLLHSDFCIRMHYDYNRYGRHHYSFQWKTTPCENKLGYICMHETATACSFKAKANTALSASSVNSVMYVVSQADCAQYCISQTRTGLECWALTYNSNRGECKMYYLQDPFLLTRQHQVLDYDSVLYTKDCFHMTVRQDIYASSSGGKYPTSPCFNSPISGKTGSSRPSTTASTARQWPYWSSSQALSPNPSVSLTTPAAVVSEDVVTTTDMTPVTSTTTPSEISEKSTKLTELSSSTNNLVTTESSSSALTTTKRSVCWCPCGRLISKKNITKEKFTEELVQGLEISKTNLSSTRRRRVSVYERRTVPVTLGSVWVGVLLALYGVVLFSDIFFYGKSSKTASSRGYGYGKRKVRPVEEIA